MGCAVPLHSQCGLLQQEATAQREPCSALNPKPGAQPVAGPPLRVLVPGKVPPHPSAEHHPALPLQSKSQQRAILAQESNPGGLQAEIVQPRVKNATMSSSRSFRCACCQNLYKQITLLSGIQQETEREIPFPGTLETYPEYSE